MTKTFDTPAGDKWVWDLWLQGYEVAAISVADEVGLFDALAAGTLDHAALAGRLGFSARAVGALCGVLCAKGVLEHQERGGVRLTAGARDYLLSRSPYYWGPILARVRSRAEHGRIIEAVRKSAPALGHGGKSFTDMWKDGSLSEEAARSFTTVMHSTILAPAVSAAKSGLFSKVKNVLDVGGGSGAFSIALATEKADLRATVFDLAPVCGLADGYIRDAGLSARIATRAGNFFRDAWPVGHDAIVLSNILHDWPVETCEELLRSAFACLAPGGRIFVHEMLLEDGGFGPVTTSCFDLLMFANHGSQQFSSASLLGLLGRVGFVEPKITSTFGYYSVVSALRS